MTCQKIENLSFSIYTLTLNTFFFHLCPAILIKVYHEEYFKVGSKKCIPFSQGEIEGQSSLTFYDLKKSRKYTFCLRFSNMASTKMGKQYHSTF